MGYNSQQKLADNISAIRVALEWEEGKILSEDEVQVLKSYSGFGGLKAILYPNRKIEEWAALNVSKEDLKLYPQIKTLHSLLQEHLNGARYKSALDSIKNSILTAFYTPEIVPAVLFNVLKEQGISPKNMYEPSSGAGVFVSEAAKVFPQITNITAIEKDILSGRVLTALGSSIPVPVFVQVKGLETTSNEENGKFDLIAGNMPFGNFKVHDEAYEEEALSGKIHNYFFVKGLDKIKEGGLMAYITTDAFLNSPSNKTAREYLFAHADFISLTVLPDNLMKDTGNTEAPSHLLIVQKNTIKESISDAEHLLLDTIEDTNEFGVYQLNRYIAQHREVIAGNEIRPGKNQYGKAVQSIWQNGNIADIEDTMRSTISKGIKDHFNLELFAQQQAANKIGMDRQLTFLPMPENKPDGNGVQLGLFDIASPVTNINHAPAYITVKDSAVIEKPTARILNIIKTTDKPEHESIVLLAARSLSSRQYMFKLFSNVAEIQFPESWKNALSVQNDLEGLSTQLQQYGHVFYNEGEGAFKMAFINKEKPLETLTEINKAYKEGTLLVHNNFVGHVSFQDGNNTAPVFVHAREDKKDLGFYRQYVTVRDKYLLLTNNQRNEAPEQYALRQELNEAYEALVKGYGMLNETVNRRRVLNDEAHGMMVLSSLERKEGSQYFKADILTQSLANHKNGFYTKDPIEALARSLNDKGLVDIPFIAAATGTTEEESVNALGIHIYLNPSSYTWETRDRFLSGNVVLKLGIAKEAVEKDQGNAQIKRSVQALESVQP